MSRRPYVWAWYAMSAALLQACTTTNLGDFCAGTDLARVKSGSLGVVLGARSGRIVDSPFIVFNTPSQAQPDATLQLNLVPGVMPWPSSLDETPCQGLDWRTYKVAVDPHQWDSFWALARPLQVEVGIGLWEFVVPLRASEFGVAIVNADTTEVLMSCGCYGT